jgi:hypothetical protein
MALYYPATHKPSGPVWFRRAFYLGRGGWVWSVAGRQMAVFLETVFYYPQIAVQNN